MAGVAQRSHWTTCIDFGTAASKASICTPPRSGVSPADLVHPLRIGSICGEPNPYVAQSALLFDRGRIYFGWHALQRAGEADVKSDILHSFKTFLAASDLKEALRLRLKRTIDRSGVFCQRDALILYVAYLLHLSERAALDDPALPPEARNCQRRYAYPTWRAGHAANTMVGAIFDAAAAVAVTFGDNLSNSAGIDQSGARRSLDAAMNSPGEGRIEAGVFEAQAAAECHVAYSPGLPDHILVFDMGAGTTDVTAFERGGDDSASMRELAHARQSFMLGCDEIDKILVRYIFRSAEIGQSEREKNLAQANAAITSDEGRFVSQRRVRDYRRWTQDHGSAFRVFKRQAARRLYRVAVSTVSHLSQSSWHARGCGRTR